MIRPFRLERYFARHEFTARYLLCSSDCESVSIRELLSDRPEAVEELLSLKLGYTESPGHPRLREAISRIYSGISPAQVLVHAGAQEAILGFMSAALEPGDRVIVQAPHYQSLSEAARARGCEVVPWRARQESGWEPDLDELAMELGRKKTRAIVVNSPHNPTGFHFQRQGLERLVSLARESGAILFSDEVYRELELRDGDRLPAACDLYENAVSLGVMSKSYGLAGLRIGWVASRNESILAAMAAFKDYTSICSSAPSELLAIEGLRRRQWLLERNRGILRSNLAALEAFISRHSDRFEWVPPRAGTVTFPRLRGRSSSSAFCEALVRETGALLLPGELFDPESSPNFRVGLGRKGFPEGLARLEEFVCAPQHAGL